MNARFSRSVLASAFAWQERAACRETDGSAFFSRDGERGPTKRRRELEAKRICLVCPVRAPCAAYALAHREPYGVWGGLSEDDRERILRTHPDGDATAALERLAR
ncbi:MAG TPA: WhiB family transcriptional regulator [Actinomycetes bacterium]|jgi:WhiB family redox-sensing transcriptional regulator|nr:WhiB family transcriptional regulator [Actinomycetes bacterium]